MEDCPLAAAIRAGEKNDYYLNLVVRAMAKVGARMASWSCNTYRVYGLHACCHHEIHDN